MQVTITKFPNKDGYRLDVTYKFVAIRDSKSTVN